MENKDYGIRLDYYATDFVNLYKYSRISGNEINLGKISDNRVEKHGPVTIRIWELENGRRYHYLSLHLNK